MDTWKVVNVVTGQTNFVSASSEFKAAEEVYKGENTSPCIYLVELVAPKTKLIKAQSTPEYIETFAIGELDSWRLEEQ